MAVTSVWPIKGRVEKVIRYVRNPEKTVDKVILASYHEVEGVLDYAVDEVKTEVRAYVSCVNLHSEETAAQEFWETKRLWGKENGRLCYHGYQSFKANEVTAAQAHAIGVALAEELWGDRFQVVVATHCNTGHFHNHYVINSVSLADGLKFYNSPADYKRMREVSDRLCREAGISVIEDSRGGGKHYSEWSAEQNGKPTVRGTIRADIDRAIEASLTDRDFYKVMIAMGYQIVTRTASGKSLAHPKVKPPGAKGYFRLRSLGEGYDLDEIMDRIITNRRSKYPFPEAIDNPNAHYHHYKEKAQKAKGLCALYFYYCYQLHVFAENPRFVKRVSTSLREDVTKLDKYIAQANFLGSSGITTTEELRAYREQISVRVTEWQKERKHLRNAEKRYHRNGNQVEGENCKDQIHALSQKLRVLYQEMRMCDDIEARSLQIQDNLEDVAQQQEEQRKEREISEQSRWRGGRTNR